MSDINALVSLGIGSPASIAKFVTFGLSSGSAVTEPTVLAGLTPAAATGDVIDADLETNLGSDVTLSADGTYVCSGGPDEYFIVRLFDDSTGTWHVMSGATGFRVYVGGTIRVPDEAGQTPTDAQTALEGLGLVVSHATGYSSMTAGNVARTSPVKYSLVNDGQTITVFESLGPAPLNGGRLSIRLSVA